MGQSLANRQHSNVSKKKAPPPASHKSASKAGPLGHKVVAKSVNLVKTPEPLVEAPPPPKGYTREGKPRERAYRTYFGVTDKGRVIKYKSYDAREIDVKEGRVKRVTAHEAREIESNGARPGPLVVSTQWSPQAGGPAPKASTLPGLIEAKAIINVITNMVGELQARISALEDDGE